MAKFPARFSDLTDILEQLQYVQLITDKTNADDLLSGVCYSDYNHTKFIAVKQI